ncbi:peptidoglycan DD-metalloendopeptidase family protein [Mesoterricola sediminis]|uniref:Peptidase M23 n=1 Tax=Mesoterricola sediminis TaxID=2927980 RepID=A0AA48KAY8_9BACT|nr:M23 family metallopeptidase [Mesoterricola sediminis]BDU75216.1 peptidase M23 [Mesoterricola sediminis]
MRSSLLVIALIVSGLSGSLQAAKTSRSATHKVRRGETAARIARDNNLSLSDLEALNPKLDLDRLQAGTQVRVRGAVPRKAETPKEGYRRALRPVPALPATPPTGPSALPHLEQILPVQARDLTADTPAPEESPKLAGIQPVLPPETAAPAPAPQTFQPADPAHLDLLWPVETRTVSSGWGPRMRSKTVKVKSKKKRVRYRGSHKGLDLNAPQGTDVYACMDGVVVTAGRQKGYGNYVMIDHGNGVITLYGHHYRNFVSGGEVVHRGQKIAEVGRTGNATGPHLHFELRVDGEVQNPLPFLNDVEEIPADQIAQNRSAVAPKTRR